MGNLRQSMTNEEWDDLGKKIKLNPPKTNFITLLEQVERLVDSTSNDQELGEKIRSLVKFGKIIKD